MTASIEEGASAVPDSPAAEGHLSADPAAVAAHQPTPLVPNGPKSTPLSGGEGDQTSASGGPATLYPSEDALLEAMDRLQAVGLKRNVTRLSVWLVIKRRAHARASDTEEIVVSNSDVAEVMDDFFGMTDNEGLHVWALPFTGEIISGDGKPNGGWPKSTVWKAVPSAFEALYASSKATTETAVRDGHEVKVSTRRLIPRQVEDSVLEEEFHRLLNDSKKIPLDALAVWRYRHGAPPGASATEDLAQLLIDELGITDREKVLLFELGK